MEQFFLHIIQIWKDDTTYEHAAATRIEKR